MKHATSTEPLNEIEGATSRADRDGDRGPPKNRSHAAKATSGVEACAERDDDVEIVDERDLLDEIGFALEQATVEDRRDAGEVKLAPRRPKAPDLLDRSIRSESPALAARLEDDDERATPLMVRADDGVPEVVTFLATPAKHLPPPPRPLPPVPVPPASLHAHVTDEPPAVTVRERRRRKPVDRPVELPAYTPGAVTIRSPLPRVPAERTSKRSWGWVAAILLVGAGSYAAGTVGARGEREAPRPATVAQDDARAAPSLPPQEIAAPTVQSIAESEPIAAPEPAIAAPESPAPPAPPASSTAVKAPEPSAAIHASALGAKSFAPPEPETSPVSATSASKGLDSSAASATLARAGAKAASCTDPRGGEGTVSVTFLPSGQPVNVKMSGRYDGTSVANCVEQIFRASRVAPFEGSATTVYFAVRLPGDGKPIN